MNPSAPAAFSPSDVDTSMVMSLPGAGMKVDEGYSGEEPAPQPANDARSIASSDVKLPNWIVDMNDAMREEYAYRLIRTLPTSHIANLVNRLTPILHLDFIQILPSELSLQILSYLPPKSLLDASLASKQWRRYALEPMLWRNLFKQQGWEANEAEVHKFEEEMQQRAREEQRQREQMRRQQEERRRRIAERMGGDTVMGGMSNDTDSRMSDEDEMYPSPHGGSEGPQTPTEPPMSIAPTLTMPGYNMAPPRLNWAFLFKNRRKLDDNWFHNRCTPFEIPHPNYPHEAHSECIYTIQYSSKYLCSGSRDRTVRVWDIKTRRLRGPPLMGHQGSVLCLQFDESPEEDIIISGSSDASVIVWRFSTGERLQVIKKAHEESVLNLRFNKKWLVTCSKDKLIKIWNRHPLETTDPEYPWHSKLLFGGNRAPINHPHHPNYQPTWQVQDPAVAAGLSLQNPFAIPSSRPAKRVLAKTIQPYTTVNALQGHVAAVNAIQLVDNEIVSASGDRVIKLWNLQTGMCEKTFVGHQKGIACIQFDGKTIVSGSSDCTIRVFDRDTQAEIATLRGHTNLVRTVQATKNKIVSGSYDESVRIWLKDRETGDWTAGPVLHQAHNPASRAIPGMVTPGGTVASVTMHQIQHIGQPGLPGAIAAAQLLPQGIPVPAQLLSAMEQQQQQQQNANTQNPNPQNPQNLQQVQSLIPATPPAGIPGTPLAPPNVPGTPATGGAGTADTPAAAAPGAGAASAPPPPQQVIGVPTPMLAGGNGRENQHRVFKLQFDARWIICCSQDSKIVGWDYAADEEGIVEASRFFLGG